MEFVVDKAADEHEPAATVEPFVDFEVVTEEKGEEQTATQAATVPEGTTAAPPPNNLSDPEVEAETRSRVDAIHRELERRKIKAVEERARKAREKNEAAAKRRKNYEDPEERAERRKKYRNYAVIILGLCMIGYWGVQGVMALIPPPKNPFKDYAVDKFYAEYTKDRSAADSKFAGKRISIYGKVKVIASKSSTIGPRVYFDVAQKDDLAVEIVFNGEGEGDVERNIKDQQEYRINGVVQHYKPGVGIVINDANVMQLK
jgi:hypothetical protein